MKKPFTINELKNLLHEQIGYNKLDLDMKEIADDCIDDIVEYSVKHNYDKNDGNVLTCVSNATIEDIFQDDSYIYDCFMYDNTFKLTFSDANAVHIWLRTALLCLYLVKHKKATAEQIDKLCVKSLSVLNKLADIYTAFELGVYESGAFGSRRTICSAHYNFTRPGHSIIKEAANLSLIDYKQEDAEADLTAMLTEH
ncbi:hypothetical protein [Photobacterium kishitanii]|uniref:Uncharacterized protein n=1 Tax=Photobacterium kishitanii TaxID=318456 RepID=A0A2T3KLQ2_9GAMM|nr:hypothetical protein [Photobacterium kishitanii]PSV00580.1 hypothetical protein C9J27_05445 [Photobacterium kishitanii]